MRICIYGGVLGHTAKYGVLVNGYAAWIESDVCNIQSFYCNDAVKYLTGLKGKKETMTLSYRVNQSPDYLIIYIPI